MTYYGKVTRIQPTSEDLQRFEQTNYFQFKHYKYTRNGYFYQDDDRRSSTYIWKPNKISVLGQKETNKIVPIKYHGFTLGTIGEGIVEPKYLIQFPLRYSLLIFTIFAFNLIVFIIFIVAVNSCYNILYYSYFLLVCFTLFHLCRNST